jgi:hypothetical protein
MDESELVAVLVSKKLGLLREVMSVFKVVKSVPMV